MKRMYIFILVSIVLLVGCNSEEKARNSEIIGTYDVKMCPLNKNASRVGIAIANLMLVNVECSIKENGEGFLYFGPILKRALLKHGGDGSFKYEITQDSLFTMQMNGTGASSFGQIMRKVNGYCDTIHIIDIENPDENFAITLIRQH